MKAIEDLQAVYFQAAIGVTDYSQCTEWALARLSADEEKDDLEIVLLAASVREAERKELAETILRRYLGAEPPSDEVVAGKYIVVLHDRHRADSIHAQALALERIFTRLFYKLGMPKWLMMLMRNCEYATDIPDFREPFRQEFEYIAGLWRQANSLEAFLAQYDSATSKSHDYPSLVQRSGGQS
ncbi:hypothetical protein [Nevskia soli]|uniref:hypothetical protein n=1 Tax=Nevskia soli TaxID=418856 RepID=UPI0004A70742|nr:hypothetical protein [Nevskia soli]